MARRTGFPLAVLGLALILALAAPSPARGGRPLVVLDPGHGGPDPGALASTGLLEKTIDLGIARAAAASLARYHIAVLLTRTDDRALITGGWNVERDLRARAGLANRVGATLLISVHVNTEPTGTVSGPIVYWEVGDAGSRRLADCLETALASVTGRYHPPRPASHLVLVAAVMPAVTVEAGFLSHPRDRAALGSPGWQAILGQAIAAGVARYLGVGTGG